MLSQRSCRGLSCSSIVYLSYGPSARGIQYESDSIDLLDVSDAAEALVYLLGFHIVHSKKGDQIVNSMHQNMATEPSPRRSRHTALTVNAVRYLWLCLPFSNEGHIASIYKIRLSADNIPFDNHLKYCNRGRVI